MSKRTFTYTDGEDCFFIERPIQYEHSISTQPPFTIICIEEVVDIPILGMFIRYVYTLNLEGKLIDSFISLEVIDHDTVMKEQFIRKAEEWLKDTLNVSGNKTDKAF